MYTCTIQEVIDPPWTQLEPVRLGRVPPGLGTPNFFVLVECEGSPHLRLDVYSEYGVNPAFRRALIWSTFVAVGWSEQAALVELVTNKQTRIDCQSYFMKFRSMPERLLITTGNRIISITRDGKTEWVTCDLGIDGVIIDRVAHDVIQGQGEWDPPGGWRRFRLDALSGTRLE